MNIKRAKQLKVTSPDKTVSYGGNQEWFSSNTRSQGACGSIAGANCLRSLCLTNPDFHAKVSKARKIPGEYKDALLSSVPQKDSFEYLMTGIYNTMGAVELFPLNIIYDKKQRDNKFFNKIKPNQGLSNFGFIIGIIRFARKHGLNLGVRSLPAAFLTKENARFFIEEGLNSSGAVVLLTSFNKHNARLYNAASDLNKKLSGGWDAAIKCHFTTITDIDNDRLLITTWGKPAVIDFNELAGSWQSVKAYQSCLMYIFLSDKKESTRCMLSSFKLFLSCIVHCLIRR